MGRKLKCWEISMDCSSESCGNYRFFSSFHFLKMSKQQLKNGAGGMESAPVVLLVLAP